MADHARRLLATSIDRHNRDGVLDAMKAWDHDTSDLESADVTPVSWPNVIPGQVATVNLTRP